MATFKAEFDTFAGADAFLGDKKGATVGFSTNVLRLDADTIAVRFHYTDVVTYKRDGGVVIENGGWQSNSTRERIKKFSPVQIAQRQGEEFWSLKGSHDRVTTPRRFNGKLVVSPSLLRETR